MTPKQEKFAQLYVELGNASEAYWRAYNVKATTKDETIWKRSSELLSEGAVSGRVEELKKDLKEKHKIDKDWIIKQHQEIIDWYIELKELARRKDLSKADTARVYMLKDLIKGSDFRGSLDSITKMLGLNESEKNVISIRQVVIIEMSRDAGNTDIHKE